MKNTQPPLNVVSDQLISVHEVFSTIQGEGPFVGRRATFIRLYGCNLQCPLCDTDYTSTARNYEVDMLVQEVMNISNELVVITGGEPYRQNISPLVDLLLISGHEVQIETNGTLPMLRPHSRHATVVCSPKESYIQIAPDYFKYVLHHRHMAVDGLPTMALANKTESGAMLYRPTTSFPRENIYVQPVETGDAEIDALNLEAAVASCRQFGYTLCLQVHKIINLP